MEGVVFEESVGKLRSDEKLHPSSAQALLSPQTAPRMQGPASESGCAGTAAAAQLEGGAANSSAAGNCQHPREERHSMIAGDHTALTLLYLREPHVHQVLERGHPSLLQHESRQVLQLSARQQHSADPPGESQDRPGPPEVVCLGDSISAETRLNPSLLPRLPPVLTG